MPNAELSYSDKLNHRLYWVCKIEMMYLYHPNSKKFQLNRQFQNAVKRNKLKTVGEVREGTTVKTILSDGNIISITQSVTKTENND